MGNLIQLHNSFLSGNLISNELQLDQDPELSYDPKESYMVAFCINQQVSHSVRKCQLDNSVINDAHKIIASLENISVLPEENSRIYVASANPSDCTREGMERKIRRMASNVGKSGAYFIHFSGHGTGDEFALAPSDYDGDRHQDTCITANMLQEWLEGCNAKYVIFIVDCCFAAGVVEDRYLPIGYYAFASCMANEVSSSVDTLGCSIFSYFLSYSIEKCGTPLLQSTATFPISAIHEKCRELTIALSSLLIVIEEGSLKRGIQQQPMLMQGIKQKSPFIAPPDTTLDKATTTYLQECGSALQTLQEENVLDQYEVIVTVLNFMMRTVCTLQVFYNPTTAATRQVYTAAYSQVKHTIRQYLQRLPEIDNKWAISCYLSTLPSYMSQGELRLLYGGERFPLPARRWIPLDCTTSGI